ncbi:hypothetical protein RclHR1_08280011 [Rhizophagus clarus]|uniref:Uncharacterized protein n=1 Tax=Rhizophagus clarus TaxID=94130 RepID=A0A2Z6S6V0_9GLOM|nr:hypothetical protein RclHR1_08280011 [Rhizophagus clarus]
MSRVHRNWTTSEIVNVLKFFNDDDKIDRWCRNRSEVCREAVIATNINRSGNSVSDKVKKLIEAARVYRKQRFIISSCKDIEDKNVYELAKGIYLKIKEKKKKTKEFHRKDKEGNKKDKQKMVVDYNNDYYTKKTLNTDQVTTEASTSQGIEFFSIEAINKICDAKILSVNFDAERSKESVEIEYETKIVKISQLRSEAKKTFEDRDNMIYRAYKKLKGIEVNQVLENITYNN